MKKRAFVALTGASGIIYGARLLKALEEIGLETYACATADALSNANAETNGKYDDIKAYLSDMGVKNAVFYSEDDHGAPPASGSFNVDYYIISPASMGFIGRIASGISSNLPERCADVALKERRPLAVLFREAPLSVIHLKNLLTLSDAGAIIIPAAPAFYGRPENINNLIDFMAGKVLDVLGIGNDLYRRWGG